MTWFGMTPGPALVHRWSNLLGWDAAGTSGTALAEGVSAGAAGSSHPPALGSSTRTEGVPVTEWLPAPREAFDLTFRTYLPGEAIRIREWTAPPVIRVD